MSVTFEFDHLRDAIRDIPNFPSPGIRFKDFTPILSDNRLLMQSVDALAHPFLESGVTKVLGIEARGFILGAILARRLDAGFIPVRKKGKLPHDILAEEYDLEYGTDCIEMHADALDPSDVVLIHDDVIATGGTAAAAGRLVHETGARIEGFAFLIELDFLSGRKALEDSARVHSVLRYK